MVKAKSRQDKVDVKNTKAKPMECRRCGVCCTKHQAFVKPEDIGRIVEYLGITMKEWDELYDDSRWQYSEYRLIRHVNGACAFLKYDKGLASCIIHGVKPACCANWEPGAEKKECKEGKEKKKEEAVKRFDDVVFSSDNITEKLK